MSEQVKKKNEYGHWIVGDEVRGFMAYHGEPCYETSVGWYPNEPAAWRGLEPYLPPLAASKQLDDALALLSFKRPILKDEECVALARAIKSACGVLR